MGEAAWANAEGSGGYCGRTPIFSQDDTGATRRLSKKEASFYIVPENMFGYYVQLNYHFMPEGLTRALPSYFGRDSTFTGILRWGQADTNTNSDTNKNDDRTVDPGDQFPAGGRFGHQVRLYVEQEGLITREPRITTGSSSTCRRISNRKAPSSRPSPLD